MIDLPRARSLLDALFEDPDALIASVVADGWPEEMVHQGFQRHRQTWNLEAIADSLRLELQALSPAHRLRWPSLLAHIWPALPGAGISPLLVSALLGIDQVIRPSSRGEHFARFFSAKTGIPLITTDELCSRADTVILSGSDETLTEVRNLLPPSTRLIGYGHRISFGIVVDAPDLDLSPLADAIAEDVVLWHQQGCFSLRALFFDGPATRREEFARLLASSIASLEEKWNAAALPDIEVARRAQALGLAQMLGPVFQAHFGFVRLLDTPFTGELPAPHSLTIYPIQGPADLSRRLAIPSHQIQGVAIGGHWQPQHNPWLEALQNAGATRITSLGNLQTPPPDWWHDGHPNALSLARITTLDL